MNCIGCGQEGVENMWGLWCDGCGGVMLGTPPKLFFRHVATADGAGGRFPIVYDLSAQAYGVAWPRKVLQVPCIHCGRQTPVETRKGLTTLDDIKPTGFYSKRGSLDEMIAFVQPLAQGESPEFPELHPSPKATDEELAIIRL